MTTNTCIRAKTDENENIKCNIKIADEYVSSWCSITFISKISATFSARALAKLSCMKTENQNPGGYHTAWSEQVNKTDWCSDGARIIIQLWCRYICERPSSLEPLENTQIRVQPPKTSLIEQISYRCEPKNSNLQRVILQYEEGYWT